MPVVAIMCQRLASPRLRSTAGPSNGAVITGAAGKVWPLMLTCAGRMPCPKRAAARTAQPCSCVLVVSGVKFCPGKTPITWASRSAKTPLSLSKTATAKASRMALP